MQSRETAQPSPHRYVFVGGLHRSGTSLVARMLAALPGVAGIEGADVPENEGIYLQGAIPHTALDGRPMQFATDPAQHHVEGGPYDRLEVKQRIEADWAPWFAPAPWRVEKSPVNLTRMRLYQQLFPRAQFVVVLRHPQAVAAAVAKWVEADEIELVAHWLDAHDIVRQDMAFLHSVLVVRYEDIVARPKATLAALAAYLNLSPGDVQLEPVRDGNAEYSRYGPLPECMARRLRAYGYSEGGSTLPSPFTPRHPLRTVQEAVSKAIGDQSGRGT